MMKLSAVCDFPDDVAFGKWSATAVDNLVAALKQQGVSRLYVQYYGNREHGGHFDCDAPGWKAARECSAVLPNYMRAFVESCKRHDMEIAAIMRPLEQGVWTELSPYYEKEHLLPEPRKKMGVFRLGGENIDASNFVVEHPQMRIKRRSWDIDPNAADKIIGSVKLYKQNNIPTRIKKENITIYTSPDNSYYKEYKDDFTFSVSEEPARATVLHASRRPQDYETVFLTEKGAPVQVLTLGNLHIKDKFVAVKVHCDDVLSENEGFESNCIRFINTPVNSIACFEPDGTEICATPGNTIRGTVLRRPFLDAGFNFDDGFGEHDIAIFDPDNADGFFAIAKGKNEYVHTALCECEPAVQEYWLSLLEQVLEDGVDLVGNRIENHATHVDEPFAYGYNDCIKEEYYRRYGYCDEQDMDLKKIAKIRGDAYTKLFIEGAKRVRAKGKKVYVTLNLEMLRDPIPLNRRYAYPMNVEWQWEKWLEEIRPDEINFRMYFNSVNFLFTDPQCRHMLETAKSYGVPLTLERYVYFDFAGEVKQMSLNGVFDRMALYETANFFINNENGESVLNEKGKEQLTAIRDWIE